MADPDNALQPPWKAYVQSKHLNGTSVPDSCCVSPEQHEECLKGVTKSIFDKVYLAMIVRLNIYK